MAEAVRSYLEARDRAERQFGVTVSRVLEDAVRPAL
jgi:hypothetical protein